MPACLCSYVGVDDVVDCAWVEPVDGGQVWGTFVSRGGHALTLRDDISYLDLEEALDDLDREMEAA